MKNIFFRAAFLFLMTFRSLMGNSAILDKVDAFRVPYANFMIQTRITTYEDGRIMDSGLFHVYFHGLENSLVIQKEGKNRRMKILFRGDQLWVQLPGSQRPLRITPIQRLMGEASNGDVARVSFTRDYRIEAVDSSDCDSVFVLDLIARRPSATYQRVRLWARKSDCRPVKGEYYALSGKHIKTAYYEKYEQIEGGFMLTRLKLTDEIRNRRFTVMEYTRAVPRDLPAAYFNKNYLVHIREM